MKHSKELTKQESIKERYKEQNHKECKKSRKEYAEKVCKKCCRELRRKAGKRINKNQAIKHAKNYQGTRIQSTHEI